VQQIIEQARTAQIREKEGIAGKIVAMKVVDGSVAGMLHYVAGRWSLKIRFLLLKFFI
jgi:hypothetical protein